MGCDFEAMQLPSLFLFVPVIWICFVPGRTPTVSNVIVNGHAQDCHPGGLFKW